MKYLPIEIIGNILSHVEGAKDLVIASATCKEWLKARKYYLHKLAFGFEDLRMVDNTSNKGQKIIKGTIFQTSSNSKLECLSIIMNNDHIFCADTVMSWIIRFQHTLRELHLSLRIKSSYSDIFYECDLQKLEVLTMQHCLFFKQKGNLFPCLRRVSLSYVKTSYEHLNYLLACPKIEFLSLVGIDVENFGEVKLKSEFLKDVYIEDTHFVQKFILKADNLEKLHLKNCSFDHSFELVGGNNGTERLKHVKIDHVRSHGGLEFHGAVNLEAMEVLATENVRIPRSSKLTSLRIWNVEYSMILDIQTIFEVFLNLTHVSLCYGDYADNLLPYQPDHLEQLIEGDDSLMKLKNVVVLELGWTVISPMFSFWVALLLKMCPNLKKLVIRGIVSKIKTLDQSRMLANFTSYMVKLMRKYMHVQVQFEYT